MYIKKIQTAIQPYLLLHVEKYRYSSSSFFSATAATQKNKPKPKSSRKRHAAAESYLLKMISITTSKRMSGRLFALDINDS